MLTEMKEIMNIVRTENGAPDYESTQDACLDLFATIGGMRHASDEELVKRFIRAYTENADRAMKLLFYTRDIRGGLGERRIFKTLLHFLALNYPGSVIRNLELVAEYGRYDDLLVLFDTPCEEAMLAYVKQQLAAGNVLLAKWLPSVNTSNRERVAQGRRIAKALHMSEREYRKTLSMLRRKMDIIEHHLCEKAYDFDYEKQCGRALYKYREAFLRNDQVRYDAFLFGVNAGTAKMNAGTIAPYELVQNCMNSSWYGSFLKPISEQEKEVLNATWNALPSCAVEENTLAIIDTSGSMYDGMRPVPAAVALSLGLYCAEHTKGLYHNHFIEFSARPQLIEIKGDTFVDKLQYLSTFNEVANTNMEAVFDVILEAAVKHRLPQEELPKRLYIISDMEFDFCLEDVDVSNFEHAKQKYAKAGYMLPQLVFWNVASRRQHVPVMKNEQGVILVSGCTPKLFEQAMEGDLNPYNNMLQVLESARYEKVVA